MASMRAREKSLIRVKLTYHKKKPTKPYHKKEISMKKVLVQIMSTLGFGKPTSNNKNFAIQGTDNTKNHPPERDARTLDQRACRNEPEIMKLMLDFNNRNKDAQTRTPSQTSIDEQVNHIFSANNKRQAEPQKQRQARYPHNTESYQHQDSSTDHAVAGFVVGAIAARGCPDNNSPSGTD